MGNNKTLFGGMFNFTVFIQMFMFIFFFFDNLYNLDNIQYTYDINGTTETTSISFYAILTIMLVLMILGALLGFNIFGAGFNESGTKLIQKYLGIGILLTLMFICSNYYILQLGLIGIILNVFFAISYAFKILSIMMGEDENGA